MVALCAHGQGERASRILTRPHAIERMAEVVSRPPAEFVPGSIVDVHAVDAGQHLPAALRVDRLVVRKEPPDHRRGVGAQRGQVLASKRRGGADDVAPEADRGSALEGETVDAHYVLEVHPAVEELVHLEVRVVVRGSKLVAIVGLWEEP